MANHSYRKTSMDASTTADREPLQPTEGPTKKLEGWKKLPPDRLEPKEIVKDACSLNEGE